MVRQQLEWCSFQYVLCRLSIGFIINGKAVWALVYLRFVFFGGYIFFLGMVCFFLGCYGMQVLGGIHRNGPPQLLGQQEFWVVAAEYKTCPFIGIEIMRTQNIVHMEQFSAGDTQ